MKRWLVGVVGAVMALSVVGCSGSSKDAKMVEVKALTMAFDQKEVTVEKGKPVKLVFTNQDNQLHDISIDEIPVTKKESHEDGAGHDMGGKEPDVHVSADAAKSATVEFTPTKEGSYTFYCTVAGHKEGGMVGTLVVK